MTIINHEYGLTVADARRMAKQVKTVQISARDEKHYRENFAGLFLTRATFLKSIQYQKADDLLPSRLWSCAGEQERHLEIGSLFAEHETMLAARKAAQAAPVAEAEGAPLQ